jgi:hypothetical protein
VRVKARAMTTCSQSTKEKWEILIEKLEDLKLMASEALDELQEEVAMSKENEDRVEAWLQSVFDEVSSNDD